jgi:hypothetical protein
MKSSRRPHFVISESPVVAGSKVRALCGHEIDDVHLAHVFDEVPVGEHMSFQGLGGCPACVKAKQPKIEGRSFVYAIQNLRSEQ